MLSKPLLSLPLLWISNWFVYNYEWYKALQEEQNMFTFTMMKKVVNCNHLWNSEMSLLTRDHQIHSIFLGNRCEDGRCGYSKGLLLKDRAINLLAWASNSNLQGNAGLGGRPCPVILHAPRVSQEVLQSLSNPCTWSKSMWQHCISEDDRGPLYFCADLGIFLDNLFVGEISFSPCRKCSRDSNSIVTRTLLKDVICLINAWSRETYSWAHNTAISDHMYVYFSLALHRSPHAR